MAAAFSFTVGSGNEDLGVPNRSREFAFTAFVTENAFFFDFAIGVFPSLSVRHQGTPRRIRNRLLTGVF